jgi:hypothetical protein
MKGGHAPIQIMRWAPADYVTDPWVRLAISRGQLDSVTFYHLFLNYSYLEGGSLPADPELLSAAIGLPLAVVRKALPFWTAKKCSLIVIRDGRAYNPRVERDVAKELEFRAEQGRRGRMGGTVSASKRSLDHRLTTAQPPLNRPSSPPSPSPAPYAAAAAEETASVSGNGASTDQRPDVRAEDSIRKARWDEERALLAAVQRIADKTGKDPPEVMREVTAYRRKDGTVAGGKTNPAQLGSAERVSKSLEDARAWLAELEGGT